MSRTTGYYETIFHFPRKISWCFVCNVPIISDVDKCPLCGYDVKSLAVGKGEVRPVFEPEKMWYRELINSEGKDPDAFLPNGMVFYYRGSIIVGGQKVFRVIYDELERIWKIKLFKKYQDTLPDLIGSQEKIVLEANNHTLVNAELESLDFIQKTFKNYEYMPKGVSFSGGKDSTVVLYLVKQLYPKIDVIYLNPTIDYPENEKYVKKLQQDWGLNLLEVRPNRNFFDLCEELGPPSQYMRWCCKVTKFAPLSRLIEEKYGTTILMASGVRKNESHSRSSFTRIQINEKIPKQLLMFPILEWNSLLVWLYMSWKKIPVNEAYLTGRSRIGCWACPERRPKEFDKLNRTHPQLWKKFKDMLINYGKNNGISNVSDWIDSGKWRLRASKYKKEHLKSFKLCSQYEQLVYKIKDSSKINQVTEFMKVFGNHEHIRGIFRIRNHSIDISIIGNQIRTGYQNASFGVKKQFERQLEKALNCINCGACVGSCKKGALKIVNGKISISQDCTHCLDCLLSNSLRKGCVALNYKPNQILIS